MRLRRFELGIRAIERERIEVYARRGDGALLTKWFPARTPDLLETAEADLTTSGAATWSIEPARSPADVTTVWDDPPLVVCGEAGVTADALAAVRAHLVLSLHDPGDDVREHVRAHLAATPGARHLVLPVRDVVAHHQDTTSARNATLALGALVAALREGRPAVVHCLMGIHRSVSVASVALARARLLPDARAAYARIHAARPIAGWFPDTVAWLEALPHDAPAPTDSDDASKHPNAD